MVRHSFCNCTCCTVIFRVNSCTTINKCQHSVSAMLNHLQWPTLEHRRNLNRITMLYKITNNLIAVNPKLYLTPQPSLSTTTRNNPLQYQIISTRTNYYKYSFPPHEVVLWNSLPYTVVNAGSLDQFKQLIQGQNI
jgi:hypothetical protein